MKKFDKLTENYLLPSNLGFLSLFGILWIYQFDLWTMDQTQHNISSPNLFLTGLTVILLCFSFRFRNVIFQSICMVLSLISIAFLLA